jgi:hypothetical protein
MAPAEADAIWSELVDSVHSAPVERTVLGLGEPVQRTGICVGSNGDLGTILLTTEHGVIRVLAHPANGVLPSSVKWFLCHLSISCRVDPGQVPGSMARTVHKDRYVPSGPVLDYFLLRGLRGLRPVISLRNWRFILATTVVRLRSILVLHTIVCMIAPIVGLDS